MGMNFSNEQDEQELKSYGPVPSGSIVIVTTEVVEANNPQYNDKYVNTAKSGLNQVNIKFTVAEGQYSGVTFRQFITCPTNQQDAALTKGQETSARIGGAMFKAMLLSANKNPANVNSYAEFGNLKFPIMVGIQKNAYVKDGRVFWNNELKKVITPAMPEFKQIKTARELINVDGAVEGDTVGSERQTSHTDSYANDLGPSFPSEASGIDDLPF